MGQWGQMPQTEVIPTAVTACAGLDSTKLSTPALIAEAGDHTRTFPQKGTVRELLEWVQSC